VIPALKLAGASCKFLVRASFAMTMYALQKVDEALNPDADEKKYYDNINDDEEGVI